MIKHYEGKLGVFDYNDKEFSIGAAIGDDDDDIPYLYYTGSKTDGSKIKIPEGIISCDFMFSYYYEKESSIVTPPVIPKGVISCRCMFQYCEDLIQAPEIPEGVKDCSEMFEGCESLEIPPAIPEGVENCSYMFDYCSSLKIAPEIPNSVKYCDNMFSNCTSLTAPPKIPNGVVSYNDMFSCCKFHTTSQVMPKETEDSSDTNLDNLCQDIENVTVMAIEQLLKDCNNGEVSKSTEELAKGAVLLNTLMKYLKNNNNQE